MNAKDMDRVAIETRLEALATEITEAQNEVDRLVDGTGTKPQAYVLAEGRLRLLRHEQERMAAALPEARQRELDTAEDAADHVAKEARKRFTERKGEIVQWLSENGWSGASDYDRAKIADMHDAVMALRSELMTADQTATKAAHLAATWWSERRPLERRIRYTA